MKRINVIGTSGSGKTTFSRQLANQLNYPYIEMDALFWQPRWQTTPDHEFIEGLSASLTQERWVLDGNYNRTNAIKWAHADTVIWIDYGLLRTLYQAIKRALIRSYTKQELWAKTGNVESFKKSFMSKDSIILWTLKTYRLNRVRYAQLFKESQYAHITFVRVTSPQQAKKILLTLTPQ